MNPPPSTRACCVVEHAGLAWRYAFFAGDELDLIAAVDRAQPGRLRRTRRAHAHEHLDAVADDALQRTIADPVDVAQLDPIHPQRLAWTHHDAAARGIELDDVKRRAGGDAQSLALADGEMNDALMPADDVAAEIDDIAGLDRTGLQPADDVGVASGRHEADILAVLLVGDFKLKTPRQFAHLGLAHVAERKAQIIELLARGCEQEITLVAIAVGGANHRPRSVGKPARSDIVPGRQRVGAELARGRQQVAKLDRAVAFDARHRRLAERVAVGKIVDHGFAEAAFIVEHVMRDADALGDVAGIVDVAAGAAGTLAMGRRTVVVKLQRDSDHVIAFGLQQGSRHRGVDATRHGDHDPCVLGAAYEIQTVWHGRGHRLQSRELAWRVRPGDRKPFIYKALRRFSAIAGRIGRRSLIRIGRRSLI